ncbi:uncharacterized protein SRS1_17152 [Sporisorium reilianum f. sp. reilianum]|uniref:FAD dependent oxidoreductase domain-containing protein n=1 Tax=Sporisorium reilianum f. sp. reilianum TaxID=72559 RepID=A0A2N8UP58_9BASI|nr:uncharacterized protein SRS1_17152 [Sporisorium reilianum f. sp. reilianum]
MSQSTSNHGTEPRATATTLVVGAGIVGSTLAHILATRHHRITLIDRSVATLPGYVGQYNALPALTELARRSVAHYRAIPDAFDGVGGLEVACSTEGLRGLEERCAIAKGEGLDAVVLDAGKVVGKAPFFQQAAQRKGATLTDADVVAIEPGSVHLDDGSVLHADTIVVCAGIWSSTLLQRLPIVPVAHPYAYTAERPHRAHKTPFVRYPDQHVYVRDHGTNDGIGSYAHHPIAVAHSQLTHSAYGEWHASFENVLDDARSILPDATRAAFEVSPRTAGEERVFNGLFSVTPDGMPLVGQLERGVYVAAAVWVTHAAGCARLVADIVDGEVAQEDAWLVKELDPLRFVDGEDDEELCIKALGTYNDIYNKGAAVAH